MSDEAAMFEVWESVEEPSLWLVFRESTSFPGAFAVFQWVQLGVCRVAAGIESDVVNQGFVTMRTNVPFDPGAVLGSGSDKMGRG